MFGLPYATCDQHLPWELRHRHLYQSLTLNLSRQTLLFAGKVSHRSAVSSNINIMQWAYK